MKYWWLGMLSWIVKTKKAYGLSGKDGDRKAIYLYLSSDVDGNFFSRPGRQSIPIIIPKELTGGVKSFLAESLVPFKELSWIKNDERQLRWLSSQIDEFFLIARKNSHLDEIEERDRIIAQIDICQLSIPTKIQQIDLLRRKWLDLKREDKIFERLKGKGERLKCQYVTEWIEKKHKKESPSKPFTNTSEVIYFFDQIIFRRSDKVACVSSVMNRYNKRASRAARTELKQCNVYLSSEAKDNLKFLAEADQVTQGKFIEMLIKREWENRLKKRISEMLP